MSNTDVELNEMYYEQKNPKLSLYLGKLTLVLCSRL